MKIHCRSCAAEIPADDVNIDNMLAKCRQCNAVFDISDQVRPREATARVGTQRRRSRVPMPSGIEVTRGVASEPASRMPYREAERTTDSLQITRRWFSAKIIFLLFFCIAWDSFLVFWYGMAGGSGNWLMIVFPIAHVAVGVGLTYGCIAGLFNRTRIKVTDQRLTVRHGPIPWKGNHDISSRDLKQLYVQRKVSRRNDSNTSESFDLNAVLLSGRKLTLLSGLDEVDQALFIEQEIEELLGIVDVEVGDEHKP